jgi:hypothetical protein
MSENTEVKPEVVTDAMLTYLDALRMSAVTNMMGAAPYLQDEFGLNKKDAETVLKYWMRTFGARHPKAGSRPS